MQVQIVRENGEIYETPIENLENVKRLIKYTDIIYPVEIEEREVKNTKPVVTKPTGKKK